MNITVALVEDDADLRDSNQVLQCLAEGLSYKQIADKMGISIDTVRTYIRRTYEKLHVRSRSEAIVKFLQK